MKLTEHDKLNPFWMRLEQDLKQRLETLRAKNDSPSLGDRDTAELRGRIAEIKAILSMSESAPDLD